jgi:hypothetical protein
MCGPRLACVFGKIVVSCLRHAILICPTDKIPVATAALLLTFAHPSCSRLPAAGELQRTPPRPGHAPLRGPAGPAGGPGLRAQPPGSKQRHTQALPQGEQLLCAWPRCWKGRATLGFGGSLAVRCAVC